MPVIEDTDDFSHGDFVVPGGGPYSLVGGTAPTKDTSIVPSGQPASAKFTVSGWLEYQYTTTPSLSWVGFFFRVNSGAEPSGNAVINQTWTIGYGQAAKIYYFPGTNEIAHTMADVGYTSAVITLDAFHWYEQIVDLSGATHTSYANLDGTPLASQADSGGGSATQAQFVEIGPRFDTMGLWVSDFLRGSAASTSDWLGQPGSVTATPRTVVSPLRW